MGAPVRVGDLLAEKYEVTKILGQGGMGVVVAARHRELDKLVALKFMHEEVAANEAAIDRFLREARAAARLRNEHVGHVLDVGRMANGVPYIVMEYLEGQDLSDVANERGPMSVSDAVEYVLQTCEAMAEAHAQGIIHRDLKPQNLFLTMRPDGRPLIKVLDFGISKAQWQQGATATQTAMGTPAYMAPEQMRSARSVDARADIWSLGVILYQLLSGALPFAGDTIAETMLKVMSDAVPPIAAFRPGLPPQIVAAIERCLRKDREQRFSNVAELAHELMPFAPERARAAMSLIERVMSAGASAAVSPSQARDDMSSVVPAVVTAQPQSTPPDSRGVQTTLGTAASQLSVATKSASSPMRWIAVMVVAVSAAVVITVLAVRGGGGGGEATGSGGVASQPADAAAPLAVEASVAPDIAVVETKSPPDAAEPIVDAKIDVKVGRLPKKNGSGSGSATRTTSGVGSGSGSAAAGSNVATGSDSASGSGSGSATKKDHKPVGDDTNPHKPVGEP